MDVPGGVLPADRAGVPVARENQEHTEGDQAPLARALT